MKYRVKVTENKESTEEFEVEAVTREQAGRLAVAHMRSRRDISEDSRTYIINDIEEINENN